MRHGRGCHPRRRRHGSESGQLHLRCPPQPRPRLAVPCEVGLDEGETVALIGRSGSGKTTVVNLLLRTLDPQEGEISYAGISEEKLTLEQIRSQIGLVPQDPFLFYGTIEDNLRIAPIRLLVRETPADLRDHGFL